MLKAWKMSQSFATTTPVSNGYLIDGLVLILTEKSRQFGFLRFAGLEESRAFLERNSPAIYLYGSSSDSNGQVAKVKIAYSRERGNWNREKDPGDWTCRSVRCLPVLASKKC